MIPNSRAFAYASRNTIHLSLFALVAFVLAVTGNSEAIVMATAVMTPSALDKLRVRRDILTEDIEETTGKLKALGDLDKLEGDDLRTAEGYADALEGQRAKLKSLDEDIDSEESDAARNKLKGLDLGAGDGGEGGDTKIKGEGGTGTVLGDLDKFKAMSPEEQESALADMIQTDKLKSLYFSRVHSGLVKPSTALVQTEAFQAWRSKGMGPSGFDPASAGPVSIDFGHSAVFDKTKGLATTNAASDPTLHNLFFDDDCGEGITDLGILRKPTGPETFLDKINTINIDNKSFRYLLEVDDKWIDANFGPHERAKAEEHGDEYPSAVKNWGTVTPLESKRIVQELQCIATMLDFDQCTLDEVNGFINWLDRYMRRCWTATRKEMALNGTEADYGFDGLLPTLASLETGKVAYEEGETAADMLDQGKCDIEADGFAVDCVLLNPKDKKKLRESASSCCEFSQYNPLTGQYAPSFHGMRPTYDKDIPEGTALIGDFSQIFWATNGPMRFRVTDSDGTKFRKNVLTGRWEQYITLAIPCPQAFRCVELCPAEK